MFKRVLVVFENESVCREAVRYARELALRMDSEVTFLMLVEISFPDRSFLGSKRNVLHSLEARVGKMLSNFSSRFFKDGIETSIALRVGNPAQEFLKFLAEREPFQAVIWGSGEELPEHNQLPRGHWLAKVITTLECPLLTVSSKETKGMGTP
ncbi:MAG TPA: universal stress protein [Deltaproteobacteria bacterium]|nr:universal stress protein [Deltaproteobacteria bacterium]